MIGTHGLDNLITGHGLPVHGRTLLDGVGKGSGRDIGIGCSSCGRGRRRVPSIGGVGDRAKWRRHGGVCCGSWKQVGDRMRTGFVSSWRGSVGSTGERQITADNGENVLDKKREKTARNVHSLPNIEPGQPFGLTGLISLGSTVRTYSRGGRAQVTDGYHRRRECALVPVRSSLG
jgi:hypothetical protein